MSRAISSQGLSINGMMIGFGDLKVFILHILTLCRYVSQKTLVRCDAMWKKLPLQVGGHASGTWPGQESHRLVLFGTSVIAKYFPIMSE